MVCKLLETCGFTIAWIKSVELVKNVTCREVSTRFVIALIDSKQIHRL